MKPLELAIAWRYLRSRRGSRLLSFITVIAVGGVTVGVSALIIIIGVMNGLQHDMREKILIGSPDIRVSTLTATERLADWERISEAIRKLPNVVHASPYVSTGALLLRGELSSGRFGYVMGLLDTDSITTMRDHMVEGTFTFRGRDSTRIGVVIGDELANRLQAYVGDTLSLLALGSQNPVTGYPMPFRCEITGVFHSGMFDYDDQFVYTDLAAARRMAALGEDVTGIHVKTADRSRAGNTGREIDTRLQSEPLPRLLVEDWQTQNDALYSALKLEKLAMSVIVFLIVVVAAFNIVSVLTMLVKDKTREIGILRAMGMTASSIKRIFRMQGVFIGLVGTGLGLLIGLSISISVGHYKLIPLNPQTYFISYLPVRTEPRDVILIALGSLVIAWLATLSPSSQASRLYPLEAIRDE